MSRPQRVTIVEVGPRDGLQNEADEIATGDKLEFIRLLAAAGLRRIEVTSFVHPKWIPQLADAKALYPQLPQTGGVRYSTLVPNAKGMATAVEAGVRDIAVFTAASEAFNQKNINCSIAESIERFRPVMDDARAHDMTVRAYVSTAFGCPYGGPVDPQTVLRVCQQLIELGCVELSISDTIGAATPGDVARVLDVVLGDIDPGAIALHMHNTRGTALANVLTGLDYGVATYDSSAGGLGGCPYAPGASGNLATEDLVYLLDGLGIDTGVSLDGVIAASRHMERVLDRRLPSAVLRAGGAAEPRGSVAD